MRLNIIGENALRISFLLLAVIMMFVVVPAAKAEDQVTKIQKAYEGIKDITGNFVQKSMVKDLKRTDTYTGKFFIKPPKMKWEYSGDKAQTIYIRAGEVIIYQKKENQVIRSKFDRATYGQAPIALLAGFGDIRQEFDVVSDKADRLVLKPKKPMGNIERIEVTSSGSAFPIRALTIIDKLSNRIDITLKDAKINSGLGDSIFSFTPPKGAAVLEQ